MWLFDPNVEKLEAKRDFDGLISALTHRKAEIRRLAADAARRLAKQGIFDVRTVEPLAVSLHDADDVVRQNAAFALGDLANQSVTATNTAAVKPLTVLLSDPNWKVRWSAAFAVHRLAWRGIFDISSVKPLIGLLSSRSRRIRTNAACALAYLARSGVSDAWKAHPALKKIASTDSDHRVRKAAKKALVIMRKETLVKLSKLMSYILRHNAEQNYKVGLDKGCYAKISQLVYAISSTPEWSWVTRKHIEEVANESYWKNKKRFVIKGDKIKAAYGITRNCPSTSTPVLIPVPPPQTPTEYCRIIAKHSGKCLDVGGESMDEGAGVIQWSYWGGDNQKWKLEPVGGGYFRIIAKHSARCLDVSSGSTKGGAGIMQWGYWGGDSQKWRLEPVGGGYFRIIAKHSGKCLDVQNKHINDGDSVIQFKYLGGDNQKWRLEPVGTPPPPPTTFSTFPPELEHLYSDPVYIDQGGFARVFKAKRNTDNRTVAVKIPISIDEGTGRSFLREITSWQRLNHENIITLYDANILPIPYLEIEYADSGSLDSIRDRSRNRRRIIILTRAGRDPQRPETAKHPSDKGSYTKDQ
jgi:hypothetical protein